MDDFEFGFADLFGSDDEGDGGGDDVSGSPAATTGGGSTGMKTKKPRLKEPPSARGTNHNLVGLVNQGATCYMNALLQALYFTPGFREQLLALSLPSSRVIPLELQRLLGERKLII